MANNVYRLFDGSPESYYWLGFIIADGSINYTTNQLNITLSSKDYDHLCKLASYIGTNCKVNSKRPICYLSAGSLGLGNKFLELGFKPQKTYNTCDLSHFLSSEKDLFLAFLTGWIDGDGSIIYHSGREDTKISLVGHIAWYDNFILMQNRIKELTGDNVIIKTVDKNVRMYIYDRSLQVYLKEVAQCLGLPILARKWDRIDVYYKTAAHLRLDELQEILKLGVKGYSNFNIMKELNVSDHLVRKAARIWPNVFRNRKYTTRRL